MEDLHPTELLPIRVRILDREYPLKVRPEDEASTRKLAESLHAQLSALKKQIPHQPDLTLAVLAAMRLAEDAARKDAEIEALRANVSAETDALLANLDAVLGGGEPQP
ncbi:MAG: cell division protein ZapA [Bacteroidota bacterium]